MLWKCCTQCASKFGKLSSKQSTGKGQCSFQSQRRAMPKNIQTTVLISNPGIESTSSAYFTHLLTGVIINIITSLSSFTLVTIMLLAKINVKSGFKTGWALSEVFLGGAVVKNLLAIQKMWVRSLNNEATIRWVSGWLLNKCWSTRKNKLWFSQFSHRQWVVSDSLWPNGLQHTRLPCPSPTPGAC